MRKADADRILARTLRGFLRVTDGDVSEAAAWQSGVEIGIALVQQHPHEADRLRQASAMNVPISTGRDVGLIVDDIARLIREVREDDA